jgi:hypothetical protein
MIMTETSEESFSSEMNSLVTGDYFNEIREQLFPLAHKALIRVFNLDVAAAGLSKTTPDGRRRDFHSLRTSLSGWLDDVPGITFPKHQAFMRHAAQDVTT